MAQLLLLVKIIKFFINEKDNYYINVYNKGGREEPHEHPHTREGGREEGIAI